MTLKSILSSVVAQMVKRLPTMQETQVRSLGQEDPLEKEMETHSSILAWKIPRIEEPGRLQSMESKRVGHDKRLHYAMLKVFYDVSKGRETKSTLGYPQFRKLSLAVAKEEMETFLTLSSKKNES